MEDNIVAVSNIGKGKEKVLEIFRSNGLTPFREILKPRDFKSLGNRLPVKKRNRALIKVVIIWLMMFSALILDSMNSALKNLWEHFRLSYPDLPLRAVSESAFCRARKRLPLIFFRDLFYLIVGRFLERFEGAIKWKKKRILAIDGTVVNLPVEQTIKEHFGCQANQSGLARQPQARLVGLISLLTGCCLDFEVMKYKESEQKGFRYLLRSVNKGDLLLMDAGFFSYINVWDMMKKGADFLMRVALCVPWICSKKEIGENDWLIEFHPSKKVRKEWPDLPEIIQARLIRYEKKGFRPSYLLTSLMDVEKYRREGLVELYHRRWGIEIVYRELKNTLNIQNLRSKDVEGILKEFHTQLMLNNLIRWLMAEAAEQENCEAVELSFKEAVIIVRVAIPIMANSKVLDLLRIYDKILKRIGQAKILKRPGRIYPRHNKKRKKLESLSAVSQEVAYA